MGIKMHKSFLNCLTEMGAVSTLRFSDRIRKPVTTYGIGSLDDQITHSHYQNQSLLPIIGVNFLVNKPEAFDDFCSVPR